VACAVAVAASGCFRGTLPPRQPKMNEHEHDASN